MEQDSFTRIAIKFAEWAAKNRWYFQEDNTWHYVFEQGTSISEEQYKKHYIKTSVQLFEIYMKENT